jgi:hypothetical protein
MLFLRLLDHLSSDAFDYWSDGLFHFPREGKAAGVASAFS